MTSIEDFNVLTDPRSCERVQIPQITFYGCSECGKPGEMQTCDCGEGACVWIEEELPWKWEVCGVCHGKGTHVNPSIDASGISPEDFDVDPGFAEEYMRGTYDVKCNACHGRTTVPVADRDAMTSDQWNLYDEQLRHAAEDRAVYLAEARMGA